jgi:hypothetical protein
MNARWRALVRMVELHPILALAAVLGGTMLTVALALVAPAPTQAAILALGFVVFVLGWPFLVSLYLEGAFGDLTGVDRALVTTCYAGALLLIPSALVVIEVLSSVAWTLIFLLAWCLGLIAAGYVMWAASRALTCAEEGRRLQPDRYLPTFLMWPFLPVTVWFIQSRIRTLLAEAAEAAAEDAGEDAGAPPPSALS